MIKKFASVGLLSMLFTSAIASDDPGPGGRDIPVQEFSFIGATGSWKGESAYPRFWIRSWKRGYELLIADRAGCGGSKASRPRAKLEETQLAIWVDINSQSWQGQCEYRSLFKINNLPVKPSPVIINAVYGIQQSGWPER